TIEPKSVKIFRFSVILISIGILISIIAVLSIEMLNEIPRIKTAFNTADALPLPKYDLYPKYDKQSVSPFEESLYWKNGYVLVDRSVYFFNFTRIIKYSIVPDIWSYFGRPNYNEQPYIESNIQIIPPTFITSSSQ
ncbi:749_t:CDS:2, partial [Gigaspora rosea]